ncbi:MAG: class I SAM-dependent DNA methyltransferase [Cellvibrionaceae bacterium]
MKIIINSSDYKMKKDHFKQKAQAYDKNKNRVNNVSNIARVMTQAIEFKPDMHIMDFGSGTGLLLERIAPFVKRITAVDISSSMNEQLRAKATSLDCELEIIEQDLTQTEFERTFDGIISSMTLHHVRDIESLFNKLYSLLNSKGVVALADLDKEDGSFHTEDTGVFHFGFDREALCDTARKAGFKNIHIESASIVHKPQGDYPVFLFTAEK